jgi:hypothetical protein
LAALLAGTWWLLEGDSRAAEQTTHAAEAAPAAAHADVKAPEPPREVVLEAVSLPLEVRRARQLERLAARLAEAILLASEGKFQEALALLQEIAGQPFYPDVDDLAARVARARMEVLSYQGVANLASVKAGAEAAAAEAREALQKRVLATREERARVANEEDLAALERHLRRFVLADPDPKSEAAADRLVRAFLTDRRRRYAKDPRPPVADPEAAEQRRVDELERLRQRNAVGLLDAIHGGLAWLALHQGADGSFTDAGCHGRCKELKHEPHCIGDRGAQGTKYGVGGTGLAAIAFLDFRDQDVHGLFDPYLAKALLWLTKAQKPDGSFPGHAPMYESAIATMALAQAAHSTGLPDLKNAAARAIAWFETAQARGGGFRYVPGAPAADLSVSAWVAQAVEASRNAGVEIPARLLYGFEEFLNWSWLGDHRFSYSDGTKENANLNPAGMLLGWIVWPVIDGPVTAEWSQWLASRPAKNVLPLYTLYYGVRVAIFLSNSLDDPWRSWAFGIATRKNAVPGLLVPIGPGMGQGPMLDHALALLTLEHALYLR